MLTMRKATIYNLHAPTAEADAGPARGGQAGPVEGGVVVLLPLVGQAEPRDAAVRAAGTGASRL